MIPFPMRDFWKSLWTYLTLKYALLLSLSLCAFTIQMSYRVPSHLLFSFLPWVGLAMSALSFVILVSHLLSRAPTDDPIRWRFRRVEAWTTFPIWAFIAYSLFLFANGALDRSRPIERASEVVGINRGEIDLGWAIPYAWADLRSWQDPKRTERILLYPWEERRLWVGQPVMVTMRHGYFRIPWVSKIERDDERHYLAILAQVPTAAQALKDLIQFYQNRKRWREATTAANQYFRAYPNDLDFAVLVSNRLQGAGRTVEAVSILEPFLAKHPTYDLLTILGWVLGKMGHYPRAVELLKAAIGLDPDNFWAYHLLGYVLKNMGNLEEAIAMFEKVKERRPNYPEVDEQLTILRNRVSAQRRRYHISCTNLPSATE